MLDTRPQADDTQVIPLIPADSDGGDPAADAQIRVNPDDLAAPGPAPRTWAEQDGASPVKTSGPPFPVPDEVAEAIGIAVGVPSPDQVFLNPDRLDFSTWADQWLAQHAPAVQAKAMQYGSNSLAAMGGLTARLQGHEAISKVEALERGCAVYAYGKMERVMDAIMRGELPGRDSWHDLAVYSLMVLFMRETGRWP